MPRADATKTYQMLREMGYQKVAMYPLDDEMNAWEVQTNEPGVIGARSTYSLAEVQAMWARRYRPSGV